MPIRINPPAPDRLPDKQRAARGVRGVVTLAKFATTPQVPLMLLLSRKFITPVYRAAFLTAAASTGMLRWMSVRPCDIDTLAAQLGVRDKALLRSWLDVGVRLGEFQEKYGCYGLKSRTARLLGQLRHDALGAGLEEVLRYHVPALVNGPQMLQSGRRFSMADQDGTVIARSSRVIQPLVERVIAAELDTTDPVRLLEIGCGSGIYVRHAAELNPHLSALAIDLQDDVVELAARNFRDWRLGDRVEVRQGDLRSLDLEPAFDLVTMHNNIYYFTDAERVQVLRQARSMLAPGGKLLLTSACQGGHISLDMLNLWLEYADFGGSLPHPERLCAQLREAGFAQATSYRVVPGEQFRAFVGINA
jgi:4-hydroxy-2,2'-bipyrrole-5-carbaldehyde O-methyltransferase